MNLSHQILNVGLLLHCIKKKEYSYSFDIQQDNFYI